MNLLQLKYFQEVARYQNITKAAKELHISQPSLSVSIKNLEVELGIELFQRKGKSIILNENGENFLRDINSVFELLNKNLSKQDLLTKEKTSIISIGGQKTDLVLSKFIATFLEKHNDTLITIKNSISVSTIDPDVLDFYVTAKLADDITKEDLIIAFEEHSILMCKEHPLAKHDCVTIDMLEKEKFIFVCPKSDELPLGYRICKSEGIIPDVACITDERLFMLSVMRKSNLVSIVPKQDADFFRQFSDFVSFPLNFCRGCKIVISTPNYKRLSGIAKDFLIEFSEQPEIKVLNPHWKI